jgi:RNA polymerase nonessential primary-like sigma factor
MSYSVDSVRSYLQEIGRVPLLTEDEERKVADQLVVYFRIKDLLAKGSEEGVAEEVTWSQIAEELVTTVKMAREIYHSGVGESARKTMINANLRLVVSIAKKYLNRGIDLLDLIQEGNIGLARAVEKFDPSKGCKFSTYAYWWIRQGMTRALAEKARTIRLPIHIVEKLNRVKKLKGQLHREFGRPPKSSEIAEAMEITEDQLEQLMVLARGLLSLDLPIGDDKFDTLMDVVDVIPQEQAGDFDFSEEAELGEIIEDALSTLTPDQREVLTLRFGLSDGKPLTLQGVGSKMKLSRERVRQIEVKAKNRLKNRGDLRELSKF